MSVGDNWWIICLRIFALATGNDIFRKYVRFDFKFVFRRGRDSGLDLLLSLHVGEDFIYRRFLFCVLGRYDTVRHCRYNPILGKTCVDC